MPNCFCLFAKSTPTERASLVEVDKLICEHFHTECHPKYWHHGWHDYIGFFIAVGKTWDWIQQELEADCLTNPVESDTHRWAAHMLDILHFLRERYTSDAWYELKS